MPPEVRPPEAGPPDRPGGRPRPGRRIGGWLVVLGGLALLANAGVLGALPQLLWLALLLLAGVAVWLVGGPRLDGGARLLLFGGVAVLALATTGRFAGTAALAFPALAFALVWVASPRRWWALLPAGVLASAGLMTAVGALFPRWDAAPVFLLGLAATFTLLYLLPPERGGRRWALTPALALIVVTVLANDPAGRSPGWLLPALLLAAGASLLLGWRRDR